MNFLWTTLWLSRLCVTWPKTSPKVSELHMSGQICHREKPGAGQQPQLAFQINLTNPPWELQNSLRAIKSRHSALAEHTHEWWASAQLLALYRTLGLILPDMGGAGGNRKQSGFYWFFTVKVGFYEFSLRLVVNPAEDMQSSSPANVFPLPSSPPSSVSLPRSTSTSTATELILNCLFAFISPRSARKNKHH